MGQTDALGGSITGGTADGVLYLPDGLDVVTGLDEEVFGEAGDLLLLLRRALRGLEAKNSEVGGNHS